MIFTWLPALMAVTIGALTTAAVCLKYKIAFPNTNTMFSTQIGIIRI